MNRSNGLAVWSQQPERVNTSNCPAPSGEDHKALHEQPGYRIASLRKLAAEGLALPYRSRLKNNPRLVVAMKQTFCQKFIFLCMKGIMILSQKITEPTRGNRCPHIPQGFEQHRLGNSTGVMLVQNIAPKPTSRNIRFHLANYLLVKEPATLRKEPCYAQMNIDKWQISVITSLKRKDILRQKKQD